MTYTYIGPMGPRVLVRTGVFQILPGSVFPQHQSTSSISFFLFLFFKNQHFSKSRDSFESAYYIQYICIYLLLYHEYIYIYVYMYWFIDFWLTLTDLNWFQWILDLYSFWSLLVNILGGPPRIVNGAERRWCYVAGV